VCDCTGHHHDGLYSTITRAVARWRCGGRSLWLEEARFAQVQTHATRRWARAGGREIRCTRWTRDHEQAGGGRCRRNAHRPNHPQSEGTHARRQRTCFG
jgi:hypothetical protein